MTLSLKPVPSLHQKLMLDQSLSSVGEPCFLSQAKLPELPVDVIRECDALMAKERHEAVPFVESEVPPSNHIVPLPAEPINNSTLLLFEGVEQSIVEWALDYGLTPAIIIGRLERGMTIADAITTPMLVGHAGQRLLAFHKKQRDPTPRKRKARTLYTFNGRSMSLAQWARTIGINPATLNGRLKSGWLIEAALSTAPIPVTDRRVPNAVRRGVVSILPASEGTGGGSTAQESSEITFSEKAEIA